MSNSISNYVAPRGLIAGHFMKSLVIGKGQMVDAIAYCEGRRNAWQATTPELYSALKSWPDLVMKTAVVANDSSNAAGVYIPDRIIGDFMPMVASNSILGRLQGVRKFPPNAAVCAFTSGTSAALVEEGARIP